MGERIAARAGQQEDRIVYMCSSQLRCCEEGTIEEMSLPPRLVRPRSSRVWACDSTSLTAVLNFGFAGLSGVLGGFNEASHRAAVTDDWLQTGRVSDRRHYISCLGCAF